ncbi:MULTISPECIES: hypothetical protein [unclassified Streptomyces]|uniref:hypothetical protein n=1 Tax=unclassified Streptomyces TaxID=2593676 RepID=UPI0022539FB2|nr:MULTISPECIES: hypothetical protein [unclassified Streptomyces]WSP56796.1 hypothetical protein OG306_22305 [Streptomyces sp. NBC_01241]MCX4788570.1 hypothetical protein [Streptomyces sp. NBC_01221]MCX4795683.1 hypothetical protein [Streptomyces sp. NBC_01242]WSJ36977.1 hypothetical protein OG772_13625 [Streptomyces sp. NBC_01321]WSP63377.1 hypothetical protein OG466_16850 [Streptomyces sp. NBC_01240]
MRSVPAVARTAAALVLFSLVAVGCSDSTSAKPSAGATQRVGEKAYYTCLKDHGLTLETTDGGALRVEKGKDSSAAILAAEKKCAHLVPAQQAPPKEQMELERKMSACLREHGVKGYPDPAPDGNTWPSDELIEEMKTNPDYRKAQRECDPRSEGGDVTVGG